MRQKVARNRSPPPRQPSPVRDRSPSPPPPAKSNTTSKAVVMALVGMFAKAVTLGSKGNITKFLQLVKASYPGLSVNTTGMYVVAMHAFRLSNGEQVTARLHYPTLHVSLHVGAPGPWSVPEGLVMTFNPPAWHITRVDSGFPAAWKTEVSRLMKSPVFSKATAPATRRPGGLLRPSFTRSTRSSSPAGPLSITGSGWSRNTTPKPNVNMSNANSVYNSNNNYRFNSEYNSNYDAANNELNNNAVNVPVQFSNAIAAKARALYNPAVPITRATHGTGDALEIRVYPVGQQPKSFTWTSCGSGGDGVGPGYIRQWLSKYRNKPTHFVVVALVRSRKPSSPDHAAAFACCQWTAKSLEIDIICGKDGNRAERYFKNSAAALIHHLEDLARAKGKSLLTLHALHGVVGFYTRLGFRRLPDACSGMSTTDRNKYARRFHSRILQFNKAGIFNEADIPTYAVFDGLALPHNMGNKGRLQNTLPFLSKCLKS